MFSRKVKTAKTGNEIASCCHTSRRSHHSTIFGGVFTAVIVLLVAACDPIQGSGAGTPPDPTKYIHVDDASRAAIVTLIAAYPATDFQFNYDGYGSGSLVLTVPVGWQVTVQCENRGTVPNSCSVVTDDKATQPIDPAWTTPDLAPGSSATFVFTPGTPGSYRIASLVDGHEASGMWLDLEVVASGRPKLEAPGG
jgi:sulfocyanin SoxE-like protein